MNSAPFSIPILPNIVALSITLMSMTALVGCVPDEAATPSPAPTATLVPDADLDGFSDPLDCAPLNPEVHPDAAEVCDGNDNDCDEQVDEGLKTQYYVDADGDGYGSNLLAEVISACSQPEGYAPNHLDCDDAAPKTHPEATEQCDGKDNDCDGHIDEGLTTRWYADQDRDGFGDTTNSQLACLQPVGYVSARGDCAPDLATVHPGASDPDLRWDGSTLQNLTVVGNVSDPSPSGIYTYLSTTMMVNTIIAWNPGYNLLSDDSQLSLEAVDMVNFGDQNANTNDLALTYLELDPGFVQCSPTDVTGCDLHLQPDSPLINAGPMDLDHDGESWEVDAGDRDPDGSRSDIGAYGGPAADFRYYIDSDDDGLYDGWEAAYMPGVEATGSGDSDHDGASNQLELESGLDPLNPDTDGDRISEGAELDAGRDPLDNLRMKALL